ncbi:secretion activating protein [Salmonella enterica subsp. enterica serovar Sanjuan]|uniref:Secretion activating protein n=1 Tax=Salmonella enterica subsp. enterica serovar Sanjuan TaxID=1160765 RepID=A0A447P0V0_SALET|nr:secretion activating protein [Salmonella enterica subsp. enterica serovar Sanjuan]
MNPIIDGIIALEGGYVFNPKDKGGATHWALPKPRRERMAMLAICGI